MKDVQNISVPNVSTPNLMQPLVEYKAAFHLCDRPMALLSVDSCFWDVNPAMSMLVGYSNEKLSQMTVMNVLGREDIDMFVSHAKALLDVRTSVPSTSFRCTIVNEAGSPIVADIQLNTL